MLGALVVAYAVRLWQQRSTAPRPSAVFRQLALELGLTRRDQSLLNRISHAQNLPTPLTLIMSRATMEHYARAYVGSLGYTQARRVEVRLRLIAAAVFGP